MPRPILIARRSAWALILALASAALIAACGATATGPNPPAGTPIAPASAPATNSPASQGTVPSDNAGSSDVPGTSASQAVEPVFTPIPDASQAPDTGAGAAAGDVPDNAVFLTYHAAAWQFDIQYVEGWQVATQTDGVVIRDKDSSETVQVVQKPANLQTWVSATDLPALKRQSGFSMTKFDRVKVGSATITHLAYHALSAPDSITGKQVPSSVDRFYVDGPALAVITLATPAGVDNVDAFRQIIGSFVWRAG